MNMLPHAELQPFRLRIEDYELLDRAGVFQGQRVELMDGGIVTVNAQFRAHALVKNRIGFRLQTALLALGSRLEAVIEASLAASPYDLPDPDILIGEPVPDRSYFRPDTTALVIEVADTTLRRDLNQKRDLYARAGISEYWVVDIAGREVHQFWEPVDGGYTGTRVVPLAGPLASAAIAGLAIEGTGIL